MTRLRVPAIIAAAFVVGFVTRGIVAPEPAVHAQAANKVYELRTYYTPDGKLEALKTRFRDHTVRLFERHGITNIGYWTPADAPLSSNTLIYLIAHDSREAAKKSWAAFGADPEWQKARAASMPDGVSLTTKVESVFLNPVDFSKLK
jgi:hypothetical protein